MIMQNNEQSKFIDMAAQKLGINPEQAKKAAEGQNGQQLLNSLSEEDRNKVSKVLSDPELTRKILSSPQAKNMLKNLFGDKK
jgi:hypothetical protein